MEMSIDAIKQLIAALDSSRLDRLDYECKEFKLSLERTPAQTTAPAAAGTPTPGAPTVSAPCVSPCGDESAEKPGHVVTAPIVGTYYASADPDKPPFVQVGSRVKKGDTLFIIESMKLMNEITSECDGTVAEIMLQSGCGVEYGQPVLRIE